MEHIHARLYVAITLLFCRRGDSSPTPLNRDDLPRHKKVSDYNRACKCSLRQFHLTAENANHMSNFMKLPFTTDQVKHQLYTIL